ncbi:MAG: motility protein A, partial [Acetivibrio ethanolgignens]
MDIATLIGLVLGFGLMIFGMVFGKTFSAVMNFIDPPSILITIGGTFSCLIAQSKDIGTFVKSLSSFGLALKPVQSNEAET